MKKLIVILLICGLCGLLAAAAAGQETQPEQVDRGEIVMRCLAAAYPDAIKEPEYIDGDWTALVWGKRYYYAQGRLLPEELKDSAESYTPKSFYNYPLEMPAWRPPSPEMSKRLSGITERRREAGAKSSPAFFDDLWQAHDKEEASGKVQVIRFLGHKVTVHSGIVDKLALVEAEIEKQAKNSAEIRNWIKTVSSVSAWNWRNIADMQSRSFHAYGTAVDILPRSLGGKETYWLWAMEHNARWWEVPYSKRYHPPQGVIKAFESHGFVWGGKWFLYDTMHFEYRPEIFLLNGTS
jgi:hypothetical protein